MASRVKHSSIPESTSIRPFVCFSAKGTQHDILHLLQKIISHFTEIIGRSSPGLSAMRPVTTRPVGCLFFDLKLDVLTNRMRTAEAILQLVVSFALLQNDTSGLSIGTAPRSTLIELPCVSNVCIMTNDPAVKVI